MPVGGEPRVALLIISGLLIMYFNFHQLYLVVCFCGTTIFDSSYYCILYVYVLLFFLHLQIDMYRFNVVQKHIIQNIYNCLQKLLNTCVRIVVFPRVKTLPKYF
jgi:hypothetical protein